MNIIPFVLAHSRPAGSSQGERRRRRKKALDQLTALFDGHDADAEIDRLKQEDEFF